MYHINMKMPRIFSPMTRNKIGVKLFLLLLKENKYHNIHFSFCIHSKTYHIRDGKSLWTNKKTFESPRFGKAEKTFAKKFHTDGSNSIPRASKGPQKARRRLPRQGVQINSICIHECSCQIYINKRWKKGML